LAEFFTVLGSPFLKQAVYKRVHFLFQGRGQILNSLVDAFHTFPFRQTPSYHLLNPLSIPFRSAFFGFHSLLSQVIRDLAELFESGFEVIGDLLGENVGIGKIVGVFQAFVPEPEDIEAGLVACSRGNLKSECPLFVRPCRFQFRP
jgi:hypothetical protein